MKLHLTIYWSMILVGWALSGFHYQKGICLTAKKEGCTQEDPGVCVAIGTQSVYYSNECLACQTYPVDLEIPQITTDFTYVRQQSSTDFTCK